MRAPGQAIAVACGAIGLAAVAMANQTWAQLQLPPAREQCSVLSGRPCHPSFCGVFHRGPCFPDYLPPISEDLRLTVVSTDENGTAARREYDMGASDHQLASIGEMFAALRDCWVPPPKDEARRGMQYTIRFAFKRDGGMIATPRMTYASHDAPVAVRAVYRDAIAAALRRCMPLHFSEGMAGAVAGRPIVIRFVDERTFDDAKGLQ